MPATTAKKQSRQRLAVDEALEDRLDVGDALEALREPGTLSAEELRARLGL